jgi:hypothetical protein
MVISYHAQGNSNLPLLGHMENINCLLSLQGYGGGGQTIFIDCGEMGQEETVDGAIKVMESNKVERMEGNSGMQSLNLGSLHPVACVGSR